MMIHAFEAFRAHADAGAPLEVCGLILRLPDGSEVYQPCRNVSESPESHFRLSAEDWAACEEQGEILAVCHSHPGSTANPGTGDLDQVQEHGLPWFILGSDGLQRVDPTLEPFEGREFVYGWTDCYSLVRDWFLAHHQVRLPDFPREEKFWESGKSPYVDHFESCGFHVVTFDQIQPGDLLLMHVQSHVPNHAAIYLGKGKILHHMARQASAIEEYRGSYQRATTHVLRRRGCAN
jgi:cell wall-associated NlpC family hydrolase